MEKIIAGKETVAAEIHDILADLQIAAHLRHLLSYMHPHLGETVFPVLFIWLSLKSSL